MNTVSMVISTGVSAVGDSFYARMASSGATEEREAAIISEKAEKKSGEVASGIFDTFYAMFAKAFPQTLFTAALTTQVFYHLTTIGASEGVLTISLIANRYLPVVPMLVAAAPLIGLAMGLNNKGASNVKTVANQGNDALDGLQKGRAVQKMGRWLGRALEVGYAGLLVSRVVQNDGRIGALFAMATLVAGVVYRYDLLKTHLPKAHALVDKVFTWKPSLVPYALGGAALVAGPTRPFALFMLFFQGMRDLFLTQGKNASDQKAAPKAV